MPATPPHDVSIELAPGVASIDRDEWNALVADGSPFLEWEFLASLEEAKTLDPETGWSARPLVARLDGRLVAACPLYVKSNSEGEFVFDFAWADAAHRAGLRYYPKLLVGVPFSPVGGARFLVRAGLDRREWILQLGHALIELCTRNELSSVHVNFCLPEEAEILAELGFHTRIGLQYHWHNAGYADFDAYLGAFRSKRRNQVRRERREVALQGVEIETLCGNEIGPDLLEPIYAFYRTTVRAHSYGRQYLNQRAFELLLDRFRHRLAIVVARRAGKPIAGTFNVEKAGVLYGRYWGALEEIRHLHFEVCYYAAVEHCIRRGHARFEPGAGGEYKQLRGFDARPTTSAHYLVDRRLSAAVEQFLARERAQAASTIDWYLDHSALKAPAVPEPEPEVESSDGQGRV